VSRLSAPSSSPLRVTLADACGAVKVNARPAIHHPPRMLPRPIPLPGDGPRALRRAQKRFCPNFKTSLRAVGGGHFYLGGEGTSLLGLNTGYSSKVQMSGLSKFEMSAFPVSLARVMGPRLARTMGPGDGHRGPADQMPQIGGRGEPGGRVAADGLELTAASVEPCGGGWSAASSPEPKAEGSGLRRLA
jgi:hypothetical protein